MTIDATEVTSVNEAAKAGADKFREAIAPHLRVPARRAAYVQLADGHGALIFQEQEPALSFASQFHVGKKGAELGPDAKANESFSVSEVKVPVTATVGETHSATFDRATNTGHTRTYRGSDFGKKTEYDVKEFGVKLEGPLASAKLWQQAFNTTTFESLTAYGTAVAQDQAHRR